MLNLFSFHLISSHRSFSWKLLTASHCHRSLCHPISSQLISTHLMSSQLFSPHLTSSHLMSSLPSSALLSWSRLFSSLLMSFELFSSLLISSQLICLSFSDCHSSSQLFSALRCSYKLILCVLISSLLVSHLLSSSHIYSADLSSCQLVSALLSSSQRTLKSSHLLCAPKTDLGAKASNPYAFHREDLTHRSFYTQQAFTQRSFFTEKFLHTASFYTEKLLHTASSCTEKLLHRSFYTQQAFTQRSPYTEKHLHRAFTHRSINTQEAFTQRSFYARSFYTRKLLHAEASTQRSFYTEKLLHTQAFSHNGARRCSSKTGWISAPKRKNDSEALFKRNFKRKITRAKIEKICWQITIASLMEPLQYDLRCPAAKDNSITHAAAAPSNLDAATTMLSAETDLQTHKRITHNGYTNCSSKTGSKAKKRDLAPKLRKSADKSLSQAWCSHSNTIYDVQLRKTIVSRTQRRHQATAETELQNATELRATASEIAAPKPDGSRRRQSFFKKMKRFSKGILTGKLPAPKLRKSVDKSLSQPWCSHFNTIYDVQLQKTIVLRTQPRRQATLTQPSQCHLQRQSCKTK